MDIEKWNWLPIIGAQVTLFFGFFDLGNFLCLSHTLEMAIFQKKNLFTKVRLCKCYVQIEPQFLGDSSGSQEFWVYL